MAGFQPEQFLSFLDRCLRLQDELYRMEEEKFACISEALVDGLLECIRKEEALLLKTRGQEQEFRKFAEQAGNPDATVRMILDGLDESGREKGEPLYGALLSRLLDVREAVARCNALSALRLRKIDSRAGSAARPEKSVKAHAAPGERRVSKKI